MRLSQVLNNITNLKFTDCEITEITLDSRKANQGALFCAINGHNIDARKFIPSTLENDVTAILADSDTTEDYLEVTENTQVIYTHNLNSKLSKIADNFYQHPSAKTNIVGITGTNGKTTIAQLVSQWIDLLGFKSATMGTIGNGFYGELTEAKNTTGSAFDIQENIAKYAEDNAKCVTMEVSSHGLVQDRIQAIDFNVVAFTNLSQDHLDYHNTMEEYFEAKISLFKDFQTKHQIINIDDEYGQKLVNLINNKNSIIAVSAKNQPLADEFKQFFYVKNVQYTNKGTTISLASHLGDFVVTTQLIGPFNVINTLQALAIMIALEFNTEDILHSASQLTPVIGRMEIFKKGKKPTIIIDYAHTPDGLEKALQAARIHTVGNLWCIFGCGGDRDVTKRPVMAQIAEENADKIIITNDNPRTENENIIIEDVKAGIKNKDGVQIIPDRFSAINYALENANSDDLILVAGKGHEDYQIIGTEKIHYSDRESAEKLLGIK